MRCSNGGGGGGSNWGAVMVVVFNNCTISSDSGNSRCSCLMEVMVKLVVGGSGGDYGDVVA